MNKTTAALLAFFTGGLGLQFIYLKKPKFFILAFLFSWTFIPALIAVYQTITFLSMTDSEFEQKYMKK